MKHICQVVVALCLLILFCGSAKAQHSGPYVGAFVGGNVLMPAESSDNEGSFSLKFDPALLGSFVAGWDFGPGNPEGSGRIELEYTHRGNPVNQAKFAEGDIKTGGSVMADSLLLNCFGVYRDYSPWSPYIGAGLGAARMEASGLNISGQSLGHGSSVVFAYQLGVGMDFALNDYLSLDLGYRFFNSIRPRFTEADGQPFKMDYLSHSVVLGLRYGF